jgi:hypothetical protein
MCEKYRGEVFSLSSVEGGGRFVVLAFFQASSRPRQLQPNNTPEDNEVRAYLLSDSFPFCEHNSENHLTSCFFLVSRE